MATNKTSSTDRILEALRGLVCAADELTDGQIDPNAGSAEREFIAALETARSALAGNHYTSWNPNGLPFSSNSGDNACGRCGATPSRCTCLKPAETE
jgi:hypothetical protein